MALHTLKQQLHTPSKHTLYQSDNILVYAVYADKKTFHVTLLARGKAEGAKVPDPSAPLEIPAKLTMTATKGITPFLLLVVLFGKFIYILDSLVQ